MSSGMDSFLFPVEPKDTVLTGYHIYTKDLETGEVTNDTSGDIPATVLPPVDWEDEFQIVEVDGGETLEDIQKDYYKKEIEAKFSGIEIDGVKKFNNVYEPEALNNYMQASAFKDKVEADKACKDKLDSLRGVIESDYEPQKDYSGLDENLVSPWYGNILDKLKVFNLFKKNGQNPSEEG